MSADRVASARVFVHGFVLDRGEKIGESVGNVVDPVNLVDTFGVDQVRYFFLREVPFGQDSSCGEDSIIDRIDADLADELGRSRPAVIVDRRREPRRNRPGAANSPTPTGA